mgnify:FL=1
MDVGNIDRIGTKIQTEYSIKQSAAENFEKTLRAAMREGDTVKLKEACRQFEQFFASMMFQSMKNTVMKSELIPESAGYKYFESLLDDKLMEEASRTGAFGIGDIMYKQLYNEMKNRYVSVKQDGSAPDEK